MNTVETLIRTRRTIRRFLQQEISEESVLKIIDAARLAPSGANVQPLKYAVVRTPKRVKTLFPYTRWAGYLGEEGAPKEGSEPTLFVVVLNDTTIKAVTAECDVGAAVENMLLQAWSEGIGSCWIGACDRPAIASLLELPETLSIHSVVAFGYPAHTSQEVPCEGSIKYYTDASDNFFVPKRSMEEVMLLK